MKVGSKVRIRTEIRNVAEVNGYDPNAIYEVVSEDSSTVTIRPNPLSHNGKWSKSYLEEFIVSDEVVTLDLTI